MKIVVNGLLVDYSDEGKGKVIVLLHGWGQTKKTFDDMTKHLVKKFRVIRLDFPGFGGSARPDDSWGVGEYGELTAALLDKLKVDTYAILGHSFGGRVAIKGLATNILEAEKLILIGSAGVKEKQTARKLGYKVVAKTGKAVTSLPGLRNLRSGLRSKLYGAIGNFDYINSGEMQKIFLNTINEDLLPYVSDISQSALLIWGANDEVAPVKDGRLIEARLKHATFVEVPDAGHFVYEDNLEAVTKELDKFL